ncbi:MAG: hypothetical protein Q4D04_12620, partial [Clostridia bacterium]|nr:hypothetical protein [Clostridia bacterium]
MESNRRFSFQRKGHFFRGIALAGACVVIAFLVCSILLHYSFEESRAQEETAVYATLESHTREFVKLFNRIGGMRYSLETAAFRTSPFFADASYEEIAGQLIDTSLMDSPRLGDVNPFVDNGEMYRLMRRIQTLVQSNYDYDSLYLYSPVSDYFIGVSNQGLSIHTAHGINEFADMLALDTGDVQRLLAGEDAAFIIDNEVLGIYDKMIFSTRLSNDLVAILGIMDDAMESTLLNPSYGAFYTLAGVTLNRGDSGIYWLDELKWYTDKSRFFGLGDAYWDDLPDIFTIDDGGRSYTVMQISLGEFSLRSAVVFERKDIFILNTTAFRYFLIFSGLWIIILISSSLLFFREWYKPVRAIARSMPRTVSSQGNYIDEYEQISQSLQKLYNLVNVHDTVISRQEQQLSKQEQQLQNGCLTRLIINGSDYVSREDIERYNISSFTTRYVLAIVYPNGHSHWNDRGEDAVETAYYDTVVVLSAQELLQKHLEAYMVRFLMHKNELILLINSDAVNRDDILNTLSVCCEQMSEQLSLSVSIHISNVYSGAETLNSAYAAARFEPPIATVATGAQASSQRASYNRLSMEMRMANQIYVGDYEQAAVMFRAIVNEIFDCEPRPGIRASLLSGLTGRTYCLLIEADDRNKQIIDSTLFMAHNVDLLKKDDLITLWQSAFLFLRGIETTAREFTPEFKEIYDYLRANFRDNSISLTKLSEIFHIGA